ncbi:mitogen-activated protein kinase kinase kinase 2-like [Physella acuta]|uniref:mitogen-activated protein kinase kinase kinase 2-like n=1 Tax=Physella acuta TaxID=109671 RepID=UPI0027DE46D9|nr:mitogen-activated protein kinase kinase kinase 2-like [Physella acuta]
MIGKGAFGTVFRVVDTDSPDEEKFVAKKIEPSTAVAMEICIKETKFLLKAKHERIVQFHGFQKTKDAFFIFLEYLKNGTLEAYISKRGNLSEELTRHFTVQILEGVDYLHKNYILHRDIKGNNILMVDDMNIKLTDFGISEIIDDNGVATEIGTVRYMAPEVIYTDGGKIINYTSRADIWSVGCTVVEMLTGKPPNSSLLTCQIPVQTVVFGAPPRYQLPQSSSGLLLAFLDRIFQRESKLRPTAEWLLNNEPFITENHENNAFIVKTTLAEIDEKFKLDHSAKEINLVEPSELSKDDQLVENDHLFGEIDGIELSEIVKRNI